LVEVDPGFIAIIRKEPGIFAVIWNPVTGAIFKNFKPSIRVSADLRSNENGFGKFKGTFKALLGFWRFPYISFFFKK